MPLAAVGYVWFAAPAGARGRRVRRRRRCFPNVVDRRAGLAPAPAGGDPAARGGGVPRRLRAAARDASRCAPRRRRRSSRSTRRARWARPTSRRRRLAAAQASARRFLADLPEKYRVAVVAFSSQAQVVAAPTRDRAYVDSRRSTALRVGEATALGDALATAVAVARGAPPGAKPPAGSEAAAGRDPRCSRTARVDGGTRHARPTAIQRARAAKIPVFTALLGTEPASSRCRTSVATSSASRCRRTPPRCARSRSRPAAATSRRRREADLGAVYADLKSRLGTTRQGRGDHVRVRGGRRAPAARAAACSRRSGSGGCRDPRRCATRSRWRPRCSSWASPPAQAADECKGLQVCIPVAGPVGRDPGARRTSRPTTTLAARVPARASSAASTRVPATTPSRSSSRAGIGSPVNPGITTTRLARLHGHLRRARAQRRRAYRPFIGCIPGGGGGPRTPTAFRGVAAIKPGEPITLRVEDARASQAGTLARTTLALPARTSACCASATASASTRRTCRRARSSPPCASCRVRARPAGARQRDAPRAARPACAPRCRCRRSARR